jgi:coatomer protein complex subunit alpha (xenin)
VSVAANPSLPPLVYNVRRNPETTELREVLPAIAFSLDAIKDGELLEANRYFTKGPPKFAESLGAFRAILQKVLLVVAKDEGEANEVSYVLRLLPSSLAPKSTLSPPGLDDINGWRCCGVHVP